MKASCYHTYGGPDQLAVEDVPMPQIQPGQVLVRVVASSINSWDGDMLRGHTLIIRLLSGWSKPRYTILGSDVAGIVEAVGTDSVDWRPGDEVMGDIASAGFGAFAEYVAVPGKLLARKPPGLSFAKAAALPQAGLLAIQGLRYCGDIQHGQRVLINGAGGGVGPIALTYAKSKGAQVTCVDRAEKLDFLTRLGADEVMDFNTTDYTRTGKRYDKILDVIAHRSAADYRRALTPTGVFAMIGGSMGGLLFRMMAIEPLLSRLRAQKLGVMGYQVNRANLEELVQLLETKVLQVAIDRTFPLTQLREAFAYFESGVFKGKIVIEVSGGERVG
jgi:NADPH:quinone reductase-like Zn-dependent oxidoreductase